MFGFWRAFGHLLFLGLICAGLLSVILLMWRRLGPLGRRRLAAAFLAVWALGLFAVTLLPASGSGWLDAHGHFKTRGFSLVPFAEIGDSLTNSVTWRVPIEQIAGNLALFGPLGVGIAMLTYATRTRWYAGFACGLVAGLFIETAQWLLDIGRISSTDDVILATLGSGLAFLVSRALITALNPYPTPARAPTAHV